MNIAIFIADSNGAFPVPASKGGAVATLVEHLVEGANKDCNNKLTVFTYYDERAFQLSSKYENVNFIWIKRPRIIKLFDKILFKSIQILFRNQKSISFATLFSLGWYILKSSHYLSENSFDKVILENNIPLAWIIKLSQFKGDYYYHLHNIPRINAKCRDVFAKCKGILCVSNYVANELKKVNCPIGPVSDKQLIILYNCIDTELFKYLDHEDCRNKVIRKYDLPSNKKIIVFVGRLSKEKGIDILLKACKKLEREDYIVLIVGSYIQGVRAKEAYETLLHHLSNEFFGKVYFTGYVEQKELPVIYAGSDLAVLPSMWDEPAGLTMVEAIGCGVSLITTKSGGIPEYIHEDCAVLLDKNSHIIDDMVVNINKILNGNMSEEKVKNGIIRAKGFSLDHYYSNFVESLYM